jgi:Uma2 family endonuclease
MSLQLPRRPFTTVEYHRLIELGIFAEDDRLELFEGEIIELSPIGPRHAACVKRLNALLSGQVGTTAIVSVQDPVQLNDYSEPQPDLVLLKPRADFYAQRHPSPADVLIAIEVADTSADSDRQVKLPAYARAAITEAWLVDLAGDRVEIYTQPGSGVYQEIRLILRGQEVVSKAIPRLKLKADDILG